MVISGFQIRTKNACNKLQVNRSIESIHQANNYPKNRWFHITNQPKQGQPGNIWRNVFQSLDATTCCGDPKELWTPNLTAIRDSKDIVHKILNWNGHYHFLHIFLLAFDPSQNVAYAYAIELHALCVSMMLGCLAHQTFNWDQVEHGAPKNRTVIMFPM